MQNGKLTIADLHKEIGELRDRYLNLSDDELFVLWFLIAYLAGDDHAALEAVAGGPNDKGIDAIFIDDRARSVFVVQAKYRRQLNKKSEKRSDILAFASLAKSVTTEDKSEFNLLVNNAEPRTEALLRDCRSRIGKRGYQFWLYYVTLGKCSQELHRLAHHTVRKSASGARIEILTGTNVMRLLRDYLDGVAPPVPAIDLEMESGRSVKINGILQRYDGQTQIESWVFSMRGSDAGSLFDQYGSRIFARNIRGYLGSSTPINKAMSATLKTEPERFFYYNNGITILCDNAVRESRKGRDLLHVENPQVINGQQTTRTLAADPDSTRASVLVKVIQVPRGGTDDQDGFNAIVSQIVSGTNWQNAIGAADLMSNDHKQIVLERELRKLGYLYVRKRQSRSEVRRGVGAKHFKLITKEQFAQAVAGCDLDPRVVRSGKDNLFKEDLYPVVFPNTDPNYYLSRYWLMRAVTFVAKGYPERGYAKWLVLNFMWSKVGPILRSTRQSLFFQQACYRKVTDIEKPLGQAIGKAFVSGRRFYMQNRGKGVKAEDVSRFFKNRTRLHRKFQEFWNDPQNTSKKQFDRYLEKVQKAISEF